MSRTKKAPSTEQVRQSFLRWNAHYLRRNPNGRIVYTDIGRLVAGEFNLTRPEIEKIALDGFPNWPFTPEDQGGGGFNPQHDKNFKEKIELTPESVRQAFIKERDDFIQTQKQIPTITSVAHAIASRFGVSRDKIMKLLNEQNPDWARRQAGLTNNENLTQAKILPHSERLLKACLSIRHTDTCAYMLFSQDPKNLRCAFTPITHQSIFTALSGEYGVTALDIAKALNMEYLNRKSPKLRNYDRIAYWKTLGIGHSPKQLSEILARTTNILNDFIQMRCSDAQRYIDFAEQKPLQETFTPLSQGEIFDLLSKQYGLSQPDLCAAISKHERDSSLAR